MNPLIVALDVDTTTEAWRLVEAIGPAANFFKVGMELYAVEWTFSNVCEEQGRTSSSI